MHEAGKVKYLWLMGQDFVKTDSKFMILTD